MNKVSGLNCSLNEFSAAGRGDGRDLGMFLNRSLLPNSLFSIFALNLAAPPAIVTG